LFPIMLPVTDRLGGNMAGALNAWFPFPRQVAGGVLALEAFRFV